MCRYPGGLVHWIYIHTYHARVKRHLHILNFYCISSEEVYIRVCTYIRICDAVLRSSPIYYFPSTRSPPTPPISLSAFHTLCTECGVFGSFPDSRRRVPGPGRTTTMKRRAPETVSLFYSVLSGVYIYIVYNII